MKKILNILAIAAAVLLSLPTTALAQMSSADEPMRPSTETWAQIQYGEVSPSLYTGTVSLSIPFYTYKDPDFEIPVSLRYASNGCLPNDPPGILGPGWSLDVGGVISREIHGIPDDEKAYITENSLNVKYAQGYYAYHATTLECGPETIYCADASFGNRKAYYYVSNTQFYDAEPDIFHFNILGRSGSFHLGPQGKVFVYGTPDSPANYSISFDFTMNGVRSGITITTADGYQYVFDGYHGGGKENTEMEVSSTTILSWHLSRIIAPNGRTVEFCYDNSLKYYKSTRPNGLYFSMQHYGDSPYGSSSDSGSPKYLSTSDVTLALLTGVKVDGQAVLSFSYTDGAAVRSYKNFSESDTSYNAYTLQRLLTGISALYQGAVIKSASLAFDNNTKSLAAYLSAVTVSGEGTYSMQYDNKQNCPLAGTFKIDHWGYYNGKSNTISNYLNISTLDANLDETFNAGNPRTPDASYAKLGTLTRITYPTGGYTTFSYEAHDYSYAVKRLRSEFFSHKLVSESGTAGGVRVKTVAHYGSDGALLAQKQYSYKTGIASSSPSSGVLAYVPRYKLTFSASFVGLVYSETGTLWSNNITRYGASHIEYSDVFETNLDGSKIHYQFTTSKSLSYMDYAYSMETLVPDRIRPSGTWNLADAEDIGNLFLCTSRQRLRGRLSGKQYLNASGAVVAEENLSFIKTMNNYDEDDYLPRYLFYSVGYEPVYIGREDTGTETESRTYGSQTVSTTTTYTYNSAGLRASQTVTGSRGEQQITRWTYISDHAGDATTTMYRQMYDAGQIDRPVTESVYTKAPGGNETLVSRRTWTYLQPSATYHPTMFRTATVSDYDAKTGNTHVTSYLYSTSNGRLLQKTDPEGVRTTYVWGYGGLYPVAQVVGAAYTQLLSITGLNVIVNTALSGGLTAAQATALRALSGAEATVWEYSPLVGLTKETTPDGRSTSYTYNASGKLHQVLDDLGRKTGAYLYSTDNKQQ